MPETTVAPTAAAASAPVSAPAAARGSRRTPAPAGLPPAVGSLGLARGGGQPLTPAVAGPVSASLGVDVSAVRVHTGEAAAASAEAAGARAFTVGRDIVLGRGEQPGDLGVMAHEVAHVVQQRDGAFSAAGGDAHEREAQQASAAVMRGAPFSVRERTAPRIQRLGLSDALAFFARLAALLPGFRMFTLLIGTNPITGVAVPRTTANLLRAVIEFVPGGILFTQALDAHGVIDRAGDFVDTRLRTLGLTASGIRGAINRFLDSLSWRDIFNLDGVWNRARSIFTDPISRVIGFAGSLAGELLRMIREAVLRPLARLAQGTRGWDLLKAVLGQDPITGEPVPRTADALVGGFMRLIGQEEVWENVRRANAISRASAWFEGALSGLMGFVRALPGAFVGALRELTVADFVVLPRAFAHVAGVFGTFALRFVSWAGGQVLGLLQIIFEAVAPHAMPYLRRAGATLGQIFREPGRFLRNLIGAGVQGMRQFGSNFLTHLRTALIGWLTGALSGANLYIPQAITPREIIKFILSVLGLTWTNVRGKLVRLMGEPAVTVLETTFDIVLTLVRDGPAAAWVKIQEQITNLRELVIGQIMEFVRRNIVQAAITRLIASLNPIGGFIQAIFAIYNTIMFFVERMRQITQVAVSLMDSITAIAAGTLGPAANRVEQTLGGLLTLVISFLARIVGLGRVSDVVVNIVNAIRRPIDTALDRVVDWIGTMARRLGRGVAGAAQRIAGWWRQRRQLRMRGGGTATLAFRGEGRTARVTMTASPEVPLQPFLLSNPKTSALDPAQPPMSVILAHIAAIDALKSGPGEGGSIAAGNEIQLRFAAIADLLGPILGAAPPRTRVGWQNRVVGPYTTPSQMDAEVLSIDSGGLVGSEPTVSFPFYDDVNRRQGAYVKGHLLNHHLFGPGNRTNLVPITRSLNGQMSSQVEEQLKEAVLRQNKVIAYRVTIVYGGWPGRTTIPAEAYLPTRIGLSAWELSPGPGTGAAAWASPVRRRFVARVLTEQLPPNVGPVDRATVNLSRDGAPTIVQSLSKDTDRYGQFPAKGIYVMTIVGARMQRTTDWHSYPQLRALGLPQAFVDALTADDKVNLK